MGVMTGRALVAVALGGMLGCVLRWLLAVLLNRYFPVVPPGTLAANLLGCYIIGVALAFFTQNPTYPLEWRLFVTTGFCGGLTTFSTFSAEVVLAFNAGRAGAAFLTLSANLVGSLLSTALGIATVSMLKR